MQLRTLKVLRVGFLHFKNGILLLKLLKFAFNLLKQVFKGKLRVQRHFKAFQANFKGT